MKFRSRCALFAAILLLLVRPNARAASDPEIDRLLKKLPAPEKLVKPDEHVLRVSDPALRDPLVKQIATTSKAKQWKRSFDLSKQLAAHYPSSPAAHAYCGLFALESSHFADASSALSRALQLQPQFVLCHYLIASAEWQQRHFNVAIQHLRTLTKLEPQAAGAWAALSMCAEIVGARQESVMAARHLVALTPRQTESWVRLAVAEKNAGNYNAAMDAMKRAVAVQRSAKSSATRKTAAEKKPR